MQPRGPHQGSLIEACSGGEQAPYNVSHERTLFSERVKPSHPIPSIGSAGAAAYHDCSLQNVDKYSESFMEYRPRCEAEENMQPDDMFFEAKPKKNIEIELNMTNI